MSETAPPNGETAEPEKAVDGTGEEKLDPAPPTQQEVTTDAPPDAPEATTDAPQDGTTEAEVAKEEVAPETSQDVVTDAPPDAPEATTDAPQDGTTEAEVAKEEVAPETSQDVVPETAEEAPVRPQDGGMYWKKANDEVVFFSEVVNEYKEDVKFESPEQFFEHRKKHGWPEDWSQISIYEEEGPPTASEEAPAEVTLPPAETAVEEGLASPKVQQVEVPDTQVDITPNSRMKRPTTAEKLKAERMQAHADRLREAVASAMAGIGDDLTEDSDLTSALSDWKAKMDSQVQELQGIVQQTVSPQVDPAASLGNGEEANPEQEKADEILGNLADVRSMRHQLESHRTGRDVEEVTNAWADPEEAEKEVEELRRVRRQIRYLFGGMIGNLPESTNLRIDDLISDQGDIEPLTSPVAAMKPKRPPGVSQSPRSMGPFSAAVAGMPEANRIKGVNAVATESSNLLSPNLPPGMPQQVRPRSGGTESLGSVTNSSVATWNGAEDEDRRRERKERKHRSRGREHRSVEPPREALKKDDGTAPSKQWNWAEEVVKASLDPSNQWEFPGAADARNVGTPSRVPRKGQPSWEQPRQAPRLPGGVPRGQDVAVKTRERAEEVIRSERERNRNFFEPSMVEAAYR